MDVTAHELRTIELPEAWRGYRQDDVDDLLDRVAGTVERLEAHIERLSERLAEAEQEKGLGREADEMLRRTLLLAQRTADAAVAEAQERARRVLSESEAHAHSIVSGAEAEARRVAITERQRVEEEVRSLVRRRDALLAELESLDRVSTDHRRRIRAFMEDELAQLETRRLPATAPGLPSPAPDTPHEADDARDELTERPQHPFTPAAAAAAALDALRDMAAPRAADPEPHVDAPDVAAEQAAEALVHDGREADDAGHADGVTEAGAPPEPLPLDDAGVSDLLPRRRGWRRRVAEEPAVDDNFFADLRRAVEEDAPLGPRDDEPDLGRGFEEPQEAYASHGLSDDEPDLGRGFEEPQEAYASHGLSDDEPSDPPGRFRSAFRRDP